VVDAADGTVLAVNRALEVQLGTPADRLRGQVWPTPLGGRRSDFTTLADRVGARGTAVVEGMLGDGIDPVWWRQRIVRVDEPERRPYLIVEVEDRTRDHQATEDLARAAHHDELTGLWNRRRFRRELRQLLADGSGPAIGLAIFDVDGFKLVNDTHGHAVGDAALVAVADAIRSGAPPGAAVARLSGDEFAAALTAPTREVARERCLRLVERAAQVVVGPSIPDLTLSAGIAVAEPGPDADRRVQDLLIDADLDMYADKTRTRAERRATFGPADDHGPVAAAWGPGAGDRPDGDPDGPDRHGGETGDGEVEVWSHPVLEVATGRPVLHDVVLHGVGPVVTFDSLVAVIRLVERHARRVIGQPQHHLVHLPNLPLGAGAAAAWLSRAADDLGLDRSAVTFALDEVHLLEPDAGTVAGFAALRSEGFGLAIDGFGARVGSLRLLTDLEPDQVWIDRRLLDAAGPGAIRSGPALVAGVLGLTARLGLRTGVAGVAADRLAHLAALAIDLALVPDDAARRPVGAVPRVAAGPAGPAAGRSQGVGGLRGP
jgi:diguanylate cyclase (GGDEF)-like protein